MKNITYKGVEFSQLESLTHIKTGEILTPIKRGKNIVRILYTNLNGSTHYIDCKTPALSVNARADILFLKQGLTLKMLEDAVIFVSTCKNYSFLNKDPLKQAE